MSDDPGGRLVCMYYVAGVADMLSVISKTEAGGIKPLCIPAKVSLGQLRNVVVKYLKAHPEGTHRAAVVQVTVALGEAFPCQA